MKPLQLLFLITLISSLNIYSQNNERRVFASAGREVSNNVNFISLKRIMTYTIGEPIIYSGSPLGRKINNGFIQPLGLTAVSPPSTTAIAQNTDPYQVFPNPVTSICAIKCPEEYKNDINLQLIDQNGKLMKQILMTDRNFKFEIDEHIPPGVYYLNFITIEGNFIQQTKLIKN